MSSLNHIQGVLAKGERLIASTLAVRAGMPVHIFNKRVCRLIENGHISREKVPGDGAAFYHYFMNARQIDEFRLRIAKMKRLLRSLEPEPDPDVIQLPVGPVDAVSRLAFLKMIRDRTVFGEHAALQVIIDDYESTLRMRADQEPDPQYSVKAAQRVAKSEQRRGAQ
ncbi:MAG: hypothetical protein ACRYGK_00170 [Janthinobacterium lividum]